MRSLFWLQQQQQQPLPKGGGCKAPTNTSLVDPMTAAALKAKEVHEEAAAAASLSLPICTALSPSARSLKIPISASAVPVNKCLPPNNGSKRGSLDSGYADSTNDSNIGIEDGGGETHAHHHHYFDGQCCQLEQNFTFQNSNDLYQFEISNRQSWQH